MTEVIRSRGHVTFIGGFEYYKDAAGDLWKASLSSVIDVQTGYRIGRWEAPPWQADQFLTWALEAEAKYSQL